MRNAEAEFFTDLLVKQESGGMSSNAPPIIDYMPRMPGMQLFQRAPHFRIAQTANASIRQAKQYVFPPDALWAPGAFVVGASNQ
jgi:hypothetical protein